MNEPNQEFKRIRFNCRRGMCELEDVLYPFVDHHFANLTVDEQQSFAQLLAAEDTQLWAWLITKEQLPPAHLKIIINKINNAA